MIALARPLTDSHSVLASARVARHLTTEEAARRAGIPEDHVHWLEEGRVYRFPSADDALVAALLYTSALGVDHREARALAGLTMPPSPLGRGGRGRLLVLAGVLLALAALAAIFVVPERSGGPAVPAAAVAAAPELPPRWEISVEVLNGSGDINWTRQLASRIGALAYHIDNVGKADRFDYRETVVYYETGGEANAGRLAEELGVETKPLPGGEDANRLVVVVGPAQGPEG